jgi:hypothetical protein
MFRIGLLEEPLRANSTRRASSHRLRLSSPLSRSMTASSSHPYFPTSVATRAIADSSVC